MEQSNQVQLARGGVSISGQGAKGLAWVAMLMLLFSGLMPLGVAGQGEAVAKKTMRICKGELAKDSNTGDKPEFRAVEDIHMRCVVGQKSGEPLKAGVDYDVRPTGIETIAIVGDTVEAKGNISFEGQNVIDFSVGLKGKPLVGCTIPPIRYPKYSLEKVNKRSKTKATSTKRKKTAAKSKKVKSKGKKTAKKRTEAEEIRIVALPPIPEPKPICVWPPIDAFDADEQEDRLRGYDNFNETIISPDVLFNNEAATKVLLAGAPDMLKTMSGSALWIGGKDEDGKLHMAAHTFGQRGTDYSVLYGPYSNYRYLGSEKTNKHAWIITKGAVDSFRSKLGVSELIKEWPGNITKRWPQSRAPFVDVDGDGIYDWTAGDYPKMKGDVMVWWSYTDSDVNHNESSGLSLGVLVSCSAYTFTCGDASLTGKVFVEYDIVNRSKETYTDTYIGLWSDPDIGNRTDDYVGSVPAMDMIYAYNGDEFDEGEPAGEGLIGRIGGFGSAAPMQSITFIKGLQENGGVQKTLDHTMYYNNDASSQGNPTTTMDYYRYLQGVWRNGDTLKAKDGISNSHYMFDGKLTARKGWTEANEATTPGDRRVIGSYGPIQLVPKKHYTFTVMYATHDNRGDNGKTYSDMLAEVKKVKSQMNAEGELDGCTGLVSLCPTGECVWPGDGNLDGVADMKDLVAIGAAFNHTGTPRTGANSAWGSHKSADWTTTYGQGINSKHADFNGDGVVNEKDVQVLQANLLMKSSSTGGSGGSRADATDESTPRVVLTPGLDTATGGQTLTGVVKMGTKDVPVVSLYGFSVVIAYNKKQFKGKTFEAYMDSSGYGGDNSTIIIIHDDTANGIIYIGVTRKDKIGHDADDIVLNWRIVVEGNVAGVNKGDLNLINAHAVRSDMKIIEVVPVSDTVIIKSAVSTGIDDPKVDGDISATLQVYPVPATTQLNVKWTNRSRATVNVLSLDGKVLMTRTLDHSDQVQLDVSTLAPAMYLVEVRNDAGVGHVKFVKTEK